MGRILVFKVSDGLPSAQPAITATQNPVPFSLTFDKYGHPVVVDAGAGSVTAYSIQSNGSLTVAGVTATGQAATCWIATNGRYIFTDNTGSGSISGFTPSASGALTLLTASSIVATTGGGTLPLDMGISQDGRYLYSLETGAGVIGAFMINPNGSLTSLGTMGSFPAVGGFQGIAVR